MTNVSIRKAEKTDAPGLLQMIAELAEEEGLGSQMQATVEALEAELGLEEPVGRFLVAEVDGHLAGFCAWYFAYSTFEGRSTIFIEDVFVRPPARRCGAASALLGRVAAEALQRDVPRVEWRVQTVNLLARRIFGSLGIEPNAEWRFCRMSHSQIRRLAR